MGGEDLFSSTTLWLAISGSFQCPLLLFVQNISVGTTVLVVRFIFCLINRDVYSQKSNFKLRFLGNELHACGQHSANYFSSFVHMKRKRTGEPSQRLLVLSSQHQLLSHGAFLVTSLTFLHPLSLFPSSLMPRLRIAQWGSTHSPWVRSSGF